MGHTGRQPMAAAAACCAPTQQRCCFAVMPPFPAFKCSLYNRTRPLCFPSPGSVHSCCEDLHLVKSEVLSSAVNAPHCCRSISLCVSLCFCALRRRSNLSCSHVGAYLNFIRSHASLVSLEGACLAIRKSGIASLRPRMRVVLKLASSSDFSVDRALSVCAACLLPAGAPLLQHGARRLRQRGSRAACACAIP